MVFNGKIAIITGGSSGIGKELAKELLKDNYRVLIIGKTKNHVQETLNELKEISGNCSGFVCDINDEKRVKYLVNEILKENHKVDLLVNNAGFSYYKEFIELSEDEIKEIINTNLLGTMYFCKFIIPYMEKQGYGHIVNVASVAGRIGFPKLSVYCAAKFGVVGFSESLYYEMKKKNINVTLVCPGAVDTGFYRDESFQKFPHTERHKKVMSPEYVAKEIKKAIDNKKFELILPKLFRFKIMFKDVLKRFAMKYVSRLPR